MNAKLIADAENLYRTAERMQRVGLIVDRAALSPAHRRAAFVLQCVVAGQERHETKQPLIGFEYPNAR